MKTKLRAACAAAVLIASPSHATVVDLHAVFSASNFSGTGAPYDPIVGDLNFTFDNAADFEGTTAGLTIHDFTLASAGYDVRYAYHHVSDTVILANRPFSGGCGYNPGTNGFCTFILNASTAPYIDFFKYSSVLTNDVHDAGTLGFGTGTAVPEPATWAMMIAGMAVIGGALRRRRASLRAVPARSA